MIELGVIKGLKFRFEGIRYQNSKMIKLDSILYSVCIHRYRIFGFSQLGHNFFISKLTLILLIF